MFYNCIGQHVYTPLHPGEAYLQVGGMAAPAAGRQRNAGTLGSRGPAEARIEHQNLVEIRHHSTSHVALNIDLAQSSEPQSLQYLILAWHTQQLGTQACTAPPTLLMIRLSRFCSSAEARSKITTPVQVEPGIQIPTFDGNTLQCSYTPYKILSIIIHAGSTPHARHYTSRLLTAPAAHHSVAQWSTDDARPAKLISRDVQSDIGLSQQSYILLLGRGEAAARMQ